MWRWFTAAMIGTATAAGGCGAASWLEGSEAAAISDRADYTVVAVSGPPSATPGAVFDVTTTICNAGGWFAPEVEVKIMASLDTAIDASDVLIAWSAVAGLPSGQCETRVTQAQIDHAGAYYLGVIVDPFHNVVEDSEANNSVAGTAIGIGLGPDLVITALRAPASVRGSFAIESTVCNQGTRPSRSFEVRFHASADSTITSTDELLGARTVPALPPDECDSTPLGAVSPPGTGAFYLGAIVDEVDVVNELLESNNQATGPLIGYGDGPDLVITAVSGPASANWPFVIRSTVCNQGTQSSGAAQVQLYVSPDPTITGVDEGPAADVLLGARPVGSLAPGQCDTRSTDVPAAPGTGAFYLGAIVDAAGAVDELIESNNHTTGPPIGIGDGPDLVITSLSVPPSGRFGFPLGATVCNQGTAPSGGFGVRFYASADPIITGFSESSLPSDLMLGSRFVDSLQPGQCDSTPTTTFAPQGTGAFYFGAIVDEDNQVAELIESNNHATGPLFGLGTGPDLVVTSVSGPPSANGQFVIDSTVCNQGTVPSTSAEVRFYASADARISGTLERPFSHDHHVGSRQLGSLEPGQCDTSSSDVSSGAQGVFYLGAIVDERGAVAELIESNNRATGSLIGLGNGTDLVVTAISAPPSADGWVPITSTVCNQGTQPSYFFIVEYYASADATITASDQVLGSRQVDFLAPGQCDTSTGVFSTQRAGTFYLGAIVSERRAGDELIESNNHTTGPQIGFGFAPDLVVTSVRGPALAPGPFAIASTVCNQGTASSAGFEVRLYASSDPTITGTTESATAADWFLGSRWVESLPPGQCDTRSTDVAAAPIRGAFYLGAIVDEAGGVFEFIESNNRATGPVIGLGNGPDLVVTSVSAPATAAGPFAIDFTVCNQGNEYMPGVDVSFYASGDTTIASGNDGPFTPDFLLGASFVGWLPPGQCHTGSTQATPPPGSGVYYLGSLVDRDNWIDEVNESNNRTTGPRIGFGLGPDLVVTQISGPVSASGPFSVASTVCNQGTGPSPGVELRLYASPDATITGTAENRYAADAVLGARQVGALAPGQCDSATDVVSSPVTGAFHLGAIVDESRQVPELIESNNHTTGSLIGIGNGPDLVVTSVTGPPSASGAFRVAATVCNQGTGPSPGAEVRLYASVDATITGITEWPVPDRLLGARGVGPLQAGQCDSGPAEVSAPPVTGAFHLGAIVDEGGAVTELIESNNHATGGLIGLGSGPDLIVTAIAGPASAAGLFAITSTVCNQGTASSSGAEVRLYASVDATISGPVESSFALDWLLGARLVAALAPGQCDTGDTEVSSEPLAGAFYLGAIVDEAGEVGELIESNNHATGPRIGFGQGTDMVVTSVTGPASAAGPFAITSTVCNQGTVPSFGGTVELYLSIDPVITGVLEDPSAADTLVGVRWLDMLVPGQCDSGSTDVSPPPGPGVFYLGAIVQSGFWYPELIESNNHTTGSLIDLGTGPDLVVSPVSGPPSTAVQR